MNDILDEDEIKKTIDKRAKNPIKTAAIYLILLFIINFIFALIYSRSPLFIGESIDIRLSVYNGVIFMGILLCLSVVLESFRFLFRKLLIDDNNRNFNILLDPFWLQVIAATFGMAIIILVVVLFFGAIALIFN